VSVGGLTSASASEDETDGDGEEFEGFDAVEERLREQGLGAREEEERTEAVVVAEEGRGLIVHGECMDVSVVHIPLGELSLS